MGWFNITLIRIIIAVFLFYSVNSCKNKPEKVQQIDHEKQDSISKEKMEYKERISHELQKIQKEIDELKMLNEPEGTETQQRIERLEKEKKTLEQRLDKIGDVIDEGWDEFKQDIENFLTLKQYSNTIERDIAQMDKQIHDLKKKLEKGIISKSKADNEIKKLETEREVLNKKLKKIKE